VHQDGLRFFELIIFVLNIPSPAQRIYHPAPAAQTHQLHPAPQQAQPDPQPCGYPQPRGLIRPAQNSVTHAMETDAFHHDFAVNYSFSCVIHPLKRFSCVTRFLSFSLASVGYISNISWKLSKGFLVPEAFLICLTYIFISKQSVVICAFMINIYLVFEMSSESLFAIGQSITYAIQQTTGFCNFSKFFCVCARAATRRNFQGGGIMIVTSSWT